MAKLEDEVNLEKHPDEETILNGILDEQLSEAGQQQVFTHLNNCKKCQDKYIPTMQTDSVIYGAALPQPPVRKNLLEFLKKYKAG